MSNKYYRLFKSQEIKNLLFATTEMIAEGFVIINESGLIQSVNPAIENMFGYTIDELRGKNVKILMTEDNKSRHDDYLKKYVSTRIPNIIEKGREVMAVKKDGSAFPVYLAVSVIEKEESIDFIGIIRDLSEEDRLKKVAEKKIMEAKLLHSAISIAADATCIEKSLKKCISEICVLMGWCCGHAYLISDDNCLLESSEIWYCKPGLDLVNLEYITETTTFESGVGLPGKILESGESLWMSNIDVNHDFIRSNDGLDLNVKTAFGFPINVHGKVVAVLEFFSQDDVEEDYNLMLLLDNLGELIGRIVERNKSQQDLMTCKVEAELANSAKSDFLSKMSHELRTPLNSIMGFSEIIMKRPKGLNEEHNNNVKKIHNSACHLLDLINEILDLSRIDSGTTPVSIEPVNIGQLFDDIKDYAYSGSVKNQIKIIDKTSDFYQSCILADSTRIRQVMINLSSNGIKYNRPGGTLTYRAKKKNGNIEFSIQDTGNGIDKKNLEKIFEPFNRLDAGNSQIEGTGIGLCIAKQLVELMSGTIRVESVLGKGSTFFIEIPLSDKILKEPKNKSEEKKDIVIRDSSEKISINILYIEDNDYNLQLVAQILSELPKVYLHTAKEAHVGISIAKSEHIHLILMDINLSGGMDGHQAMKILKNNRRTQHIPIIALSANAMRADIKKCLDSGFDAYIIKPYHVDDFVDTIKRIISQKVIGAIIHDNEI